MKEPAIASLSSLNEWVGKQSAPQKEPRSPIKHGPGSEAWQKFEKALVELDQEFKTWTDTIHESERLSEDDFAIRINARDSGRQFWKPHLTVLPDR